MARLLVRVRRLPEIGPTPLDEPEYDAAQNHREQQEQDRRPPRSLVIGGQEPRDPEYRCTVDGPKDREDQKTAKEGVCQNLGHQGLVIHSRIEGCQVHENDGRTQFDTVMCMFHVQST